MTPPNSPLNEPWMDSALCAQTDPDMFFPENGASARPAKKICAECPVREACLEFALRTNVDDGVWGGLSITELRLLRGPNPEVTNRSLVDYTYVAELVRLGYNDREVAVRANIWPETVWRWRKKNGVPANVGPTAVRA